MNHFNGLKVITIMMSIIVAANAYREWGDYVRAFKSNYNDHGLDGYLLGTDEQTGLLIPPKPLTNAELRALIVESKWKHKYCKLSIDYTWFNQQTYNGHYCLQKLDGGSVNGQYKNLCCGNKTCDCKWVHGTPYKCDCQPPKIVE